MDNGAKDYINRHLNIAWLRPLSALWDAIASSIIRSNADISEPAMDIGCGNGLFSFVTAGGDFNCDYDWYVNTKPEKAKKNADIYDVKNVYGCQPFITREPDYVYLYGCDAKKNLLAQAEKTGLYTHVKVIDANCRLPFDDGSFKSIFSNILYWLDDRKAVMSEIHRVLTFGGEALLCVPTPKFYEYCFTYSWEHSDNHFLRALNNGRSATLSWTVEPETFIQEAKMIGFEEISVVPYLSKKTLRLWDVGLRPLSPVLIKMIRSCDMHKRREFKIEWIEALRPLMYYLFDQEMSDKENKGFCFYVFRKK